MSSTKTTATARLPSLATPLDGRRLLARFALAGALASLVAALILLPMLDGRVSAPAVWGLLGLSAGASAVLWALKRGLRFEVAAPITGLTIFVGLAITALGSARPFPVGILVWNVVIPTTAVLLGRLRVAITWTVVVLLEIVAFYLRTLLDPALTDPLALVDAISLAGVVCLAALFAYTAHRVRVAALARQEQLREQAELSYRLQRMGQIAGAVAHDFNNLLTVVQTYTSLLLDSLGEDAQRGEDLREVLAACERGAELTNSLRTFAQNQPVRPEPLDLVQVLVDLEQLINSLVGDRVELVIRAPSYLGPVMADRAQLEQVIVNLVLNARDAMPAGGRLEVIAGIADLDEMWRARGHGSGEHAQILIRDSGVGMSAEVLEQAFEPFFTTKPRGRATGLGLSTAYGLVKSAGGILRASSEQGVGSSFEIRLPIAPRESGYTPSEPIPERDVGGDEVVLVVDDEVAIVRSVGRLLRAMGYTVLATSRVDEAQRLFDEHRDEIGLVLTDALMPELTGAQLAQRFKAARPDVPICFMSGYSGDTLDGLDMRGPWLRKPFSAGQLLRTVRRVIDEANRGVRRTATPTVPSQS